MSDEARYTMAEAQRVQALNECARHGHSWSIAESVGGGPYRILCETCGWSGSVVMGDRPKAPEGQR